MGNVEVRSTCAGAPELAWWKLDNVMEAAERAKIVQKKHLAEALRSGIPLVEVTGKSAVKIFVSKSEFVEVFTDLTATMEMTKALALNLSAYDLFADPDSGKVDASEVLALLALFCKGPKEGRMKCMFNMFREAYDPPKECLNVMFSALWKVDFIKEVPAEEDIDAVVQKMRKLSGAALPTPRPETPPESPPEQLSRPLSRGKSGRQITSLSDAGRPGSRGSISSGATGSNAGSVVGTPRSAAAASTGGSARLLRSGTSPNLLGSPRGSVTGADAGRPPSRGGSPLRPGSRGSSRNVLAAAGAGGSSRNLLGRGTSAVAGAGPLSADLGTAVKLQFDAAPPELPEFTEKMWTDWAGMDPKVQMFMASAESVVVAEIKKRRKQRAHEQSMRSGALAARARTSSGAGGGAVGGGGGGGGGSGAQNPASMLSGAGGMPGAGIDRRTSGMGAAAAMALGLPGGTASSRLAAKAGGHKFVQKLSKETNFDIGEIKQLRKTFQGCAGEDGELSRDQFFKVMVEAYPQYSGEGMSLAQLFDSFDTDDSETIDFREFTVGMSRLTKGSLQDKLELLFEVYDVDGDGNISIAELLKFISSATGELLESTQFSEELLDNMDKDGDGSINKNEFFSALEKNPVLLEAFRGSVVPHLDGLKAPIGNLQRHNPHFSLGLLKQVWDRSRQRRSAMKMTGQKPTEASAINTGMNLIEFRKFMVDEFKIADEQMPIINRVFHLFDKDKSGEVDYKELFSGLAQAMAGEPEEKAEFYFHICDRNDSGDLDKNELMQMLISNKEATSTGTHAVTELLERLDEDGDGTVSLDEFKNVSKQDPTVLNAFSRLFGDMVEEEDEGAETGLDMTDPMSRKVAKIAQLLSAKTAVSKGVQVALSRKGLKGLGRELTKEEERELKQAKKNIRRQTVGLQALRRLSVGLSSEVLHQLQNGMSLFEGQGGAPASVAAKEHANLVKENLKKNFRVLSTEVAHAKSEARMAEVRAELNRQYEERKAAGTTAHIGAVPSYAREERNPTKGILRRTGAAGSTTQMQPATTWGWAEGGVAALGDLREAAATAAASGFPMPGEGTADSHYELRSPLKRTVSFDPATGGAYSPPPSAHSQRPGSSVPQVTHEQRRTARLRMLKSVTISKPAPLEVQPGFSSGGAVGSVPSSNEYGAVSAAGAASPAGLTLQGSVRIMTDSKRLARQASSRRALKAPGGAKSAPGSPRHNAGGDEGGRGGQSRSKHAAAARAFGSDDDRGSDNDDEFDDEAEPGAAASDAVVAMAMAASHRRAASAKPSARKSMLDDGSGADEAAAVPKHDHTSSGVDFSDPEFATLARQTSIMSKRARSMVLKRESSRHTFAGSSMSADDFAAAFGNVGSAPGVTIGAPGPGSSARTPLGGVPSGLRAFPHKVAEQDSPDRDDQERYNAAATRSLKLASRYDTNGRRIDSRGGSRDASLGKTRPKSSTKAGEPGAAHHSFTSAPVSPLQRVPSAAPDALSGRGAVSAPRHRRVVSDDPLLMGSRRNLRAASASSRGFNPSQSFRGGGGGGALRSMGSIHSSSFHNSSFMSRANDSIVVDDQTRMAAGASVRQALLAAAPAQRTLEEDEVPAEFGHDRGPAIGYDDYGGPLDTPQTHAEDYANAVSRGQQRAVAGSGAMAVRAAAGRGSTARPFSVTHKEPVSALASAAKAKAVDFSRAQLIPSPVKRPQPVPVPLKTLRDNSAGDILDGDSAVLDAEAAPNKYTDGQSHFHAHASMEGRVDAMRSRTASRGGSRPRGSHVGGGQHGRGGMRRMRPGASKEYLSFLSTASDL